MKTIEITFSVLLILGLIAFVVAIFKYPKDFVKLIKAILFLPLLRVWDLILFFLSPIWILVLAIEKLIGLDYLSRLSNRIEPNEYETDSRKSINFSKFKKFLLINSTNLELIKKEIVEAKETCLEVNIVDFRMSCNKEYSIVEVPNSGFYGFNFLIQWLSEQFKNSEVYGFATNGRSKFFTYVDRTTENKMIGRTNTHKKFWLSMYDDLNRDQFLRMSETVTVKTNLTTSTIDQLIKNAI